MKGCVQKKGKFYYAVVAIGRKRKWFQGGQAQKEAHRVLNQKINEIQAGTYHEIPKIRFAEFARDWLTNYAEVNVKPSTFARYKDIIERLLVPEWGQLYPSNLTAIQIQRFAAERLRTVSPKTVSCEIGLIKEMFRYAHEFGYVKADPAKYVKRPKMSQHEIEILNPEETAKFLAHTPSRFRLAFLTCVLTGMRAGELWALRWSDIDFNLLQIHVRQSLWRGKFQSPKSRSSFRSIDIPEQLAHELKKWKLLSPPNGFDLVFPNTEGKAMAHDNVVRRVFEPALKKAGLRKVCFHSLRHTNASMRIAAGQNIKYIQKQLGHSSIKITLDIYGHLFNDFNFSRQQVRLLEASLDSTKSLQEERLLPAAGASSP